MKTETRTITLGSYQLSYDYNLAGELTSVTDPFGQNVSYGYDMRGRLNNVGATGFPNVSQFASNVHYRAWGGNKNMTYGNGKTLSVGYNARLAPASYQIPNVLNKTYQYFEDGSLKSASDLLDNRYDRALQYDPIGRLAAAETGTEARGGATPDGPFSQTYRYDAFGHTTARTSRQWTSTFGDSGTYQNERHNGWSYDADGNVTNNTDVQFTYDAAGLPTRTVNLLGGSISANGFDGDGQRIRSAFQLDSSAAATTKYYLRATALGGQVVAEILSSGEKAQGYVYSGNELLAVQKLPVVGDSANYVVWRHEEPSGSVRGTDEGGGQNWAAELNSAERDATGVDMGTEDPGSNPLNTLSDENNPDPLAMGNPTRLSGGCKFNGMPIADCGFLLKSSSFDQFNLVEVAAKASTRIVGYREKGVSWGKPFDATYDENGHMTSMSMGELDPELQGVNYGNGSAIYADSLRLSFISTSTWLQNPAPQIDQKKYDACAKLLGKSPRPSKFAAEAILWASSQEGTDTTLIAVTWAKESGFDCFPKPNPRKDGGFDVGPLQTSTTYFNKDRFVNTLSDDAGEVTGTWVTKDVRFSGNPYLALRWGSRALNDGAGRKGRPKGVSDRADMAGIYRSGSSRTGPYQTRVNEFNALQPGYDAFFNCLRK